MPPKVLVSGMGTQTFPWRITFANMGQVTVAESGRQLSAVATIPENSGSAISGGKADAVRGITHVVGSRQDDRIYGTAKASQTIMTFAHGDASLPDQHTLVLDHTDLRSDQAVLYSVEQGTAINGLRSGTVYYVEVGESAR